jgi:hypothetical protein
MEFKVIPLRREGKLIPRHAIWSGQVIGDLYVAEERDIELNRAVRIANIVQPSTRAQLLPSLHDAILVAAKPDWWTMTGFERARDAIATNSQAYLQSWVLIPVDRA